MTAPPTPQAVPGPLAPPAPPAALAPPAPPALPAPPATLALPAPLAPRAPPLPRLPRFPFTWPDRRRESRSSARGREQALPDEERAGVTGGESGGVSALLLLSRLQCSPPVLPALNPSGKASSCPSDNFFSRLSRHCCALSSGHTGAHALRTCQPSPPPLIPVCWFIRVEIRMEYKAGTKSLRKDLIFLWQSG